MNVTEMRTKELETIVGGLSSPSKMPGFGYSISAHDCITGSKLRLVKGSVCSGCYALKGRYAFPMVQNALDRRYKSLSDPRWVEVMAELISRKSKKAPYFRWHDSGDLQSVDHLEMIANVAKLTPQIFHWLPTREYRIVKDYIDKHGKKGIPKNLNVRMSAHMIGGLLPKFTKPLTISSVSRNAADYKKSHICPAPKQGNNCGDCRACWDRTVPHVDYHLH